jgi:hypothetical protein
MPELSPNRRSSNSVATRFTERFDTTDLKEPKALLAAAGSLPLARSKWREIVRARTCRQLIRARLGRNSEAAKLTTRPGDLR